MCLYILGCGYHHEILYFQISDTHVLEEADDDSHLIT